jgi:hypothetical protein
MPNHDNARALDAAQIINFVDNGFVRIDHAFPKELAREARDILWKDLAKDSGCDPNDPATWTKPVIRLGHYAQPPFHQAANAAVLHKAFDQLVGTGRWQKQGGLGTFPVRFPSPDDPGDTGWHVDVSFGFDQPHFMEWRANVVSKGRALLMLFLFSDVGENDAPTRLRLGSHRDVARLLAPASDEGMTLRELVVHDFGGDGTREEALATGEAGTVYLCHPFLVHAAQPHRGTEPRFMAQPPLLPAASLRLDRAEGDTSPVEAAIRMALMER